MGLFFGTPEGKWMKHTHLFGSDTFECSECGREFKTTTPKCPRCGAKMKGVADAWQVKMDREALEEEYDEIEGIEDADY